MSTKDLENSGLLQRGLRLEELVKLSQRRAEGDELRESEEERLLREEEEHKTGCGHRHQHSGPSSNPEEHVAASSGEPSIGESEQKPRKRLPDSSSPDNPSPINDYLFGDAAPLPKKEASFPHFDESNATTTAERSMAYGNQLRNEALQSLHAQIRELEEKEAKERLQTTIPKEEGKPEERVEEPSVKLDATTTRSAPPDETSPWFASFFKGASEQKISPHSGATQSQIENGFRESVSWSDRIKRSAQAMEERHGSIGRLIAEKALEAEAKHRLTPQEKEQFQLPSEEQGRHVRPPVGSSSNLPWSVRCMMKAKSTPMPPRAQLARTAVNIMANGGRLASRRKVVPLKRLAPKEKASSSQSQKEETGCTIM
ncbi:hypothetical protein BT69DRAFT_881622 [Atractiella rhizophila]|nr:hypothetical protein BT69DRAFT_881622 [Atractiella rhizophila]